jgi:hypothetical protein
LARCTDRFARQWWHWFFYAQPDKPERAINADPDAWYGGDPAVMGAEAYEEYRQAIHDPDTVTRCWRTTARAWAWTTRTTSAIAPPGAA